MNEKRVEKRLAELEKKAEGLQKQLDLLKKEKEDKRAPAVGEL